MPERSVLQALIADNRWKAHSKLFRDSHDDAASPAHKDLVEAFWSDEQRLIIIGFRGFGKSTTAEEAVAIAACAGEFQHALFIGPSETRAVERLEATKAHIELNDNFLLAWGEMRHVPWQETRAALTNGVVLTALGVGQKIRGIKRFQARPDFIVVDDFEDEENVLTPDSRRKIMRWFLRTLRLACHPRARWRVLTTLMDADCVPIRLEREAGWPVRRFPVSYLDDNGVEQATWPARFPMEWITSEREEYLRLGEAGLWDLEMMCDSTVETGAKDFKPEYFRVEPQIRTWQPVWAVFDPARTRTATSASTGIVIFSWIGERLVVWEDRTGFYLPSEMIEIMFDIEARYQPIAIGFEQNGLEEWALTLIRSEALKRGMFLPIRPLRAPRDKHSFIRGLEAYARSGQLVFASECPTLRDQFLSFPRGRIDGPNALAYAQELRPGSPVFDGFAAQHIALDLPLNPWRPAYLCVNARDNWTTAALCQLVDGQLRVLADWCYLGSPEEHISTIADEARLVGTTRRMVDPPQPRGFEALKDIGMSPIERRAPPIWVIPEWHYDRWLNIGLEQAVRRLPARAQKGAPLGEGREWLKQQIERVRRGEPGLVVSSSATWTLRAFSGGYCRSTRGIEPETGQYRCLIEGIEAWAALLHIGYGEEDEEPEDANYSYDRNGRRYQSILPVRH
jgi:hypothetical protein